MNVQKDVLNQIVGLGLVMQDTLSNAVNNVCESTKQQREGFVVTSTQAIYKSFVDE